MNFVSRLIRLMPLAAVAFIAATSFAAAQPDPDKPVTPPDSYRVVMENDRMRMIEVHIRAHSKVNVDSPANRDRFLYMLSDGALILAQPGKTPYEFALHAGETAVFPPVSPTVENDTDAAVRALMVEVKEPSRAFAGAKSKGRQFAKRGARGKIAARSTTRSGAKSATRSKSTTSTATRSKSKTKHAAKPAKPQPAASKGAKPPLNLSRANSRPTKKVTGRGRGNES